MSVRKIIVYGILALLTGCTPPTGAPGRPITVDIHGYCAVFDTTMNYYKKLLPDLQGVSVEIENSPHKTVTDSKGNWTLKDVPAGIYSLKFSKAGYSIMRLPELNLLGGKFTAPNVALSRLAGFYKLLHLSSVLYNNNVEISAKIKPDYKNEYNTSAPNNEQGVLLLVSIDKNASPFQPETYIEAFATLSNDISYNDLIFSISLDRYKYRGVKTGDDICISAFPYWRWRLNANYLNLQPGNGGTFYVDPATGNFVSTVTDTFQVRRIFVKIP